eukprot:jgi/Psemu1/57033/gm1.57033_g
MVSEPTASQSETFIDLEVDLSQIEKPATFQVKIVQSLQSPSIQVTTPSIKNLRLSIEPVPSLKIQVDPNKPPPVPIKVKLTSTLHYSESESKFQSRSFSSEQPAFYFFWYKSESQQLLCLCFWLFLLCANRLAIFMAIAEMMLMTAFLSSLLITAWFFKSSCFKAACFSKNAMRSCPVTVLLLWNLYDLFDGFKDMKVTVQAVMGMGVAAAAIGTLPLFGGDCWISISCNKG